MIEKHGGVLHLTADRRTCTRCVHYADVSISYRGGLHLGFVRFYSTWKKTYEFMGNLSDIKLNLKFLLVS